ncbi:astacin-like [Anopheles ziemanni]|uniref:astacin-like n=1 Tax=Anopheles coustani TaxID=139045 RepID=UPI00265ACB47|nr:astacin-like [Anopheles coustani]XP_058177669.1 astacin-like [Anopheles ziemanni]
MASKNYLISFVLALISLWNLALSAQPKLDYTKPSAEVGLRLKGYDPKTSPGFPHEFGFGHYYQGDIILRPTLSPKEGGRLALNDQFVIEKWFAATVPYVIQGNFTERELGLLQDSFAQFAAQTCVRFVPRTNQLHYVTITNADEGCYSYVGRSPHNEYNRINLQTPECFTDVGTPVHEMMHSIGFFHEFTRYDRDQYVTIDTANLRPEYQDPDFIATNFGIMDPAITTTYNVPYNYRSVMHYSRYAGAIGLCCPVINNTKPYFGDFGSIAGLTPLDTKQINAKYCKKSGL